MTCVVAVSDGQRVTMGGDSLAVAISEREQYPMTMPKVFQAGPYVVGYSGVWRIAQVLWKEMEWPEPEGTLDYDFAIRRLVPAIESFLVDRLGREVLKDLEKHCWDLLVGHKASIFGVTYRFEALAVDQPFIAIGSGRKLAYGALHALQGRGVSSSEMVVSALSAAARYVPGVGGPFRLVRTDSSVETVIPVPSLQAVEIAAEAAA